MGHVLDPCLAQRKLLNVHIAGSVAASPCCVGSLEQGPVCRPVRGDPPWNEDTIQPHFYKRRVRSTESFRNLPKAGAHRI